MDDRTRKNSRRNDFYRVGSSNSHPDYKNIMEKRKINFETARLNNWQIYELNYLVAKAGEMSAKQLADVLNKDISSIYFQLHRFGIPFKRIRDYRFWTTKDVKQLIELRAEGKTFPEISAILGRSAKNCEYKYGQLKKAKETIRQNG